MEKLNVFVNHYTVSCTVVQEIEVEKRFFLISTRHQMRQAILDKAMEMCREKGYLPVDCTILNARRVADDELLDLMNGGHPF